MDNQTPKEKELIKNLQVDTSRSSSFYRHKDDFDNHDDSGRQIISEIYYNGKTIEATAKKLNISESRVIAFIEALYSDARMRLKYDFSTVRHGLRNDNLNNCFTKHEPLDDDEMNYGNVPKSYLRVWEGCSFLYSKP